MARIVFMGTPEFAVPVLEALTKTPHDIPGVFTRPDQPAGRGKKVQSSPVKVFVIPTDEEQILSEEALVLLEQ